MAGITLKVKGLKPLRRRATQQERKWRSEFANRLPAASALVIAAVRRGNFFNKDSGKLKRSISAGPVVQSGASVRQDISWGVPYGRVLEWGPFRKRTWVIKARKAKFLRFAVGGKVVFAKQVTHRWTPKEMRPHFGPTLFRLRSALLRILGREPKIIFGGTGLGV